MFSSDGSDFTSTEAIVPVSRFLNPNPNPSPISRFLDPPYYDARLRFGAKPNATKYRPAGLKGLTGKARPIACNIPCSLCSVFPDSRQGGDTPKPPALDLTTRAMYLGNDKPYRAGLIPLKRETFQNINHNLHVIHIDNRPLFECSKGRSVCP